MLHHLSSPCSSSSFPSHSSTWGDFSIPCSRGDEAVVNHLFSGNLCTHSSAALSPCVSISFEPGKKEGSNEERKKKVFTVPVLTNTNSPVPLVSCCCCCCFGEIHTHTYDHPWCKNAQFAFLEEGHIFLGCLTCLQWRRLETTAVIYHGRYEGGQDSPAASISVSLQAV